MHPELEPLLCVIRGGEGDLLEQLLQLQLQLLAYRVYMVD